MSHADHEPEDDVGGVRIRDVKHFSSMPRAMIPARSANVGHRPLGAVVELQVLGPEQRLEGGAQLRHGLDLLLAHAGEEGREPREGVERLVLEDGTGGGRGLLGVAGGEGLDQVLLGLEMVVEGALGDAGAADDVVDRGAVVAALGEQAHGAFQDLGAPDLSCLDETHGESSPAGAADHTDRRSVGQSSGDDVGQEDVLELDDAVLEQELALLEALDEHLVGEAGGGQSVDGGVEVGVLLPFGGKLKSQGGFLFLGQRQHLVSDSTRHRRGIGP